ncbi:MAG TPA: SemiSWEET family transporter [Solirubrobacteraceae bacterium]
MSAQSVLAVVAGAFGVLMGASPLLQAVRAHRRRSAEDVSLAFLATLWCGGLAWLAYGLALGNPALIVANVVGVLCSGTALGVSLYWSRPPAGGAVAEVGSPETHGTLTDEDLAFLHAASGAWSDGR